MMEFGHRSRDGATRCAGGYLDQGTFCGMALLYKRLAIFYHKTLIDRTTALPAASIVEAGHHKAQGWVVC